jgi:probable F420-dependent oxidoreductase
VALADRLGRSGLWAGQLSWLPHAAQVEVLAEVEAAGFGTIWYGESMGREAFALGAILLGNSKRINVATGIANIYARDPMAMANGGRALEQAWPGRFVLGLGVSHVPMVEGRGHEYGKPVTTMAAYLDAMEQAPWRGPDTPLPPIVLAALGPRMLKLSARRTAGAHPYFVPVEHTRQAREVLGRGPLLAPEQAVVFASSRNQAQQIAAGHMRTYLSLPNYRNNLVRLGWTEDALNAEQPDRDAFDALVAWGDEDAILERLREHLDAGADHVVVQPLTAEPEQPYVEEVRRLGRVIAKL